MLFSLFHSLVRVVEVKVDDGGEHGEDGEVGDDRTGSHLRFWFTTGTFALVEGARPECRQAPLRGPTRSS